MMHYSFAMLEGEHWWGGTAADGWKAPYTEKTVLTRDFCNVCPNQTMPMLLSDRGRCIWSEEPFELQIADGQIEIEGEKVVLEQYGSTLREAYCGAQQAHFPPRGAMPEPLFFQKPQYNTWMQFTYSPTQQGVLDYARSILAHGFVPGILIIDEGWQKEYGCWEFDPIKFPDPRAMAQELHEMGFTLMLWVVPFVRADGYEFVKRTMPSQAPTLYDKHFIRTDDGRIAIMEWWNGYSASFDMTKACDREALDGQLQRLMREIGVDGFKFDGGSFERCSNHSCINGRLERSHTAAERNEAWNEFGTRYRFHEYKDTFKGGGKRVIQRLQDRFHSWDHEGLNTIIPNALQQGLLGHPFLCPDMIGGGEWEDRAKTADPELFVRMAQCSALFPMMQFSWAPWEALEGEHLAAVKAAHDLHLAFADTIDRLVQEACRTGEPILRALAYNHPNAGYEEITDQFMLGTEILVAPVIQKGERVRRVVLPAGIWCDQNGVEYVGGQTVEYPAPLAVLPYFIRKQG